jgi:hypothetical protein
MAGNDNHTYGFNREDHDALISVIEMTETETPGRRGSGGGGGGGANLFAFELTGGMVSNSGPADISSIDGIATVSLESSTVYDPQNIFATLGTGDTGLCIKQRGKYYIIQANCPAGYL